VIGCSQFLGWYLLGMTVLVNGDVGGTLSVLDPMVLRGDGCFEAARIYGGVCFKIDDHLDRLARSAAALEIELPALDTIKAWCTKLAQERDTGVIRVLASAGPADLRSEPGTLVVLDQPLPEILGAYRLLPVVAPWHPAGVEWTLAGVKTLSYAPNMAASRQAREEAFDDALLISRDGTVLEMPTSTVAWVIDGTLETPTLELGILGSITRMVVLGLCERLEIPVVEGRFATKRLAVADEVMVLSSIKEVRPVTTVGRHIYEPGPTTAELGHAYSRLVVEELAG